MKSTLTLWSKKFNTYLYEKEGQVNADIMKFIEITIRHQKLLYRLGYKPSTFEEIENYLQQESELTGLDLNISQRSLQRDIQIISELYHINIVCDKASGKYSITEKSDINGPRLLQHLDILMALTASASFPDYISIEPRAGDTKFLNPILRAIKRQLQISFKHRKNYITPEKTRTLAPYMLKEHDRRWYVFGMDMDKNEIRIFSLDRICDLTLTPFRFEIPNELSPKSYFEHIYGTELTNKEPILSIEITTTTFQGNYLKSVPLHETQKLISENDNSVTFSFRLIPKHNFIMKLIAFGENLVAVEPKPLRDKICIQVNALKRNLEKDNYLKTL